jgi:hypothetical protein
MLSAEPPPPVEKNRAPAGPEGGGGTPARPVESGAGGKPMPLRRWILFVVLLALSCVAAYLPVIYTLVNDPRFFTRAAGAAYVAGPVVGGGPAMLLTLLEPLLDYGLLRRRYWAYVVSLPYFGSRGVFAAGLTIGQTVEAGPNGLALGVGIGLAALWGGIALFIYLNKSWFDR